MVTDWAISYYKTSRGDELVKQFIDQQDKDTQAKIFRLLQLVALHGPKLSMPYARPLGKGLHELRVRSNNEIRVFYIFILEPKAAILLHAFKKRSQKLPAKEMAIALARQKELT
jgi:phage-related protein